MTNNKQEKATISTLPTQMDLFLADFMDVAPKGDMKTMEYPLFSLQTKPDTEIFRYEYKGHSMEVIPGATGRATIFDKDLLLYCIGQLKMGEDNGREPLRKIRITAYDFLKSTHRKTGGRQYDLLASALVRLRGTTFKTTIMGSGSKRGKVFGLIESGELGERGEDGRFVDMTVTLSEWLFDAVTDNAILKYNRDYFELRKPNERRMYEICRKHCGAQQGWQIGLDNLYAKFGTRAKRKEFTRTLKTMVEQQNIPDYQLTIDEDLLVVNPK